MTKRERLKHIYVEKVGNGWEHRRFALRMVMHEWEADALSWSVRRPLLKHALSLDLGLRLVNLRLDGGFELFKWFGEVW